ncbi:MAG: hypothetical protein R3D62_17555 [Xanthobacteraceae bacterium]
MAEETGHFKHRMFLVFSKADVPAAYALQRALENIRVPAELIGKETPLGPVPPRLESIYRYGDDLPDMEIEALTEPALAALADSAFLVVLCSPNAAKSDHVNEAIRRFKLMDRQDRIIPVIIPSETQHPENECFPATLRYKLTEEGALSIKPEEPVAPLVIDARAQDGGGQEQAARKLAATVLGVDEADLPAPPAPEPGAILPDTAAPAAFAPAVAASEPEEPATAAGPVADADKAGPGAADAEPVLPVEPAVAAKTTESVDEAARNEPAKDETPRIEASKDEAAKPAETTASEQPPRKRRRSRLGLSIAALVVLIAVLTGFFMWARRELETNPPLLDRTLATGTDAAARVLAFADRFGLPPSAVLGLADSSEWTFRELAELGPDTPMRRYREAAMYLALARQDEAIGRPDVARQRIEKAKALLATVKPQELDQSEQGRDVALAQLAVGNALLARGATDEALAILRPSLEVMERRKDAAADAPERQRDLSLATIAVGDALLAKGMPDAAMQQYREALALRQQLVAREPKDEAARRDLSLVQERVGDVRAAKGETADALEDYRTSLALRLAAVDPGTSGDWQRQLSVSFNKIGDMLVARNALDEALNNYRAGLALQLAAPLSDSAARRDLSVSYERIGDLLRMERNWDDALAAYRKSLAIRENLAAADPANPRWARDLSVSYERIGDVMLARTETDDAIAAYRTSLSLRERLAKAKNATAVSERDVAVAHNKLGDALMAKGNTEDAVKSYRAGLAIREKLAAAAPDDAQLQWDLLVLKWRLASTGDDPAKRFGEIVATLRDMAAKRKLSVDQARWLPAAEQELARAKSQ